MESTNESKMVAIYALDDPRTGQTYWIGQTRGPLERRLRAHLRESGMANATNAAKKAWIAELVALGLCPCIRLLERVPPPEAHAAECRWMDACTAQGAPLLNVIRRRATPWQPPRPQWRPSAPGEFLTAAQAARMLGVTSARVRHMVRDGLLPAGLFGRDLAIDAAAVERLAQSKRRPGRPPKHRTERTGQ